MLEGAHVLANPTFKTKNFHRNSLLSSLLEKPSLRRSNLDLNLTWLSFYGRFVMYCISDLLLSFSTLFSLLTDDFHPPIRYLVVFLCGHRKFLGRSGDRTDFLPLHLLDHLYFKLNIIIWPNYSNIICSLNGV